MELREIELEDVFPDEKNPRKDFGDIAALAESCMLNAINPGEPVNPIVVVEDGGIYRIVDGERRYKAMAKNKLKRCHAVVCEDLDEANSMVAMVATDDKQQLSEIERSRGVQQMLLLGVDPERIERVGRLGKGGAAKLRRARQAVDDAGDDMTLDRMLAIAEFEEAGDEEAVERLTNCVEAAWRGVADDIRDKRARKERVAALKKACEDAGIATREDAPKHPEYLYFDSENTPSQIADACAGHPEGTVAWICEMSYNAPEVRFYRPRAEPAADPEEAARVERSHEVEAMISHCGKRMAGWYARSANEPDGAPSVRAILMPKFFKHSDSEYYKEPGDHVVEFAKQHGMDMHGGVRYAAVGAFAVYLYVKHAVKLPGSTANLAANEEEAPNEYNADTLAGWIEWADAFMADGYEPDDAERELREIVEAILARADEADEEEEEQA